MEVAHQMYDGPLRLSGGLVAVPLLELAGIHHLIKAGGQVLRHAPLSICTDLLIPVRAWMAAAPPPWLLLEGQGHSKYVRAGA